MKMDSNSDSGKEYDIIKKEVEVIG